VEEAEELSQTRDNLVDLRKNPMTEYSLLSGDDEQSRTGNVVNYEINWPAHVASQIIYSRQYMVVYFAGLILSLFLLIYDIMDHPNFRRHEKEPLWFIILDVLCVMFLIAEVGMRYQANPTDFWTDPLSCVDPFVIFLSIVSLAMYPIWLGSDYLGTSVLGIRYFAVSCRLCFFLKRGDARRRAQSVAENTRIIIDDEHPNEPTWGDADRSNQNNLGHSRAYKTFQSGGLDPAVPSRSHESDSISTTNIPIV